MWLSYVLLSIIVSLLIYSFLKYSFYRSKNFPPGPPRLPIWGSYWFLLALDYKFPAKALHWLSKFYKSKLIGLYLGAFPTVVVHGAKAVKEMLIREEFDGRMDVILGRLRANGEKLGIFFTDGAFWHEQRRFALRYMRDWGFGRRCPRLEQLILNEISVLVDFMNNPPNDQDVAMKDLFYMPDVFYVPFINSFLGVIRGRALEPSRSARLWEAGRCAILFQRSGDDLGGALSLTPWVRHIAPIASGYVPLKFGNQNLVDLVQEVIDECKKNLIEEYDTSFFDKYLKALRDDKVLKEGSTFSEAQLALIGVDFLFPTATANASLIAFLIRELMHNTKVQKKIHSEIDSVVGRGRLPNLDDRINMPYTEACLREIMRKIPLVPMGIPHRAQVDTTFEGYFIPKDTMMVANLWSYHMDPEIWGDPENFRPERFLDADNKLLKQDISLIFGAGKRLCAGETFARQTTFLVAAGILQNFNIEPANGTKKPKLLPGIILTPENFWARLTPRD